MEKLGEKTQAKPGSRLMPTGVVLLVLSIALLVFNLSSDVHEYVSGVGYVQVGGKPSAGFWILLLSGAICASVGFARRVLSSK
jgi:hypothetical protein